MSLLGFDALGRLALGQLSTIGLTNTVLPADPASYLSAGSSTEFEVTQNAATGVFSFTCNAAAARAVLLGASTSYALTGNAATLRVSLAGDEGRVVTAGNVAWSAVQFPAFGDAYAIVGNAAPLGAALRSGAGSYLIAGYPTEFTRDFEAWFPRPFNSESWTVTTTGDPAWSGKTVPAEAWTAETMSSDAWKPAIKQPVNWSSE